MSETAKIHQIVYASRFSPSVGASEIQAILEKSRSNNERNGVTGILLCRASHFLQLLEGERFNMAYTFKKIRDDQRHDRLQLIMDQTAEHRLFERWSMGYREVESCSPELSLLVRDVVEARKQLPAQELLSLLRQFNHV
jgi:hypothetical protein